MGDFLNWVGPLIRPANLLVSVAIAITGGFLYWRRRPTSFGEHHFMKVAFWFLLSRWILLGCVYLALILHLDQRWVIAFSDLQSACDVGFAWIFIQGDEYSVKNTLQSLFVLCLVLLLWNLAFHPNPGSFTDFRSINADILARSKWIAASEALSAFSVPLVGYAFLLRYRIPEALVLFLFTLGYTILQRPIYDSLLLTSRPGYEVQNLPSVVLYLCGLVIGKLILGGMIYGFFFAHVERHSVVTSKLSPETIAAIRSGLKKSAKMTANAALALGIAVFAAIIVERYHLVQWISSGH